jgi:iron complex outermembrane receptor protein
LSADDFRALVNEQGSEDQKKLLGEYSTDWQKVIFQQALTSDNNISYGGSIGKLPFRISTGFLNQQGILRTDKTTRTIDPLIIDIVDPAFRRQFQARLGLYKQRNYVVEKMQLA